MITLFRKILVPVDFTANSEIAIRKAMELIDREGSVISLLHVLKPLFSLNPFSSSGRFFAPRSEIFTEPEIKNKLDEYKERIRYAFPDIDIQTNVCNKGKVQKNIIQAAGKLSPDLIIISKSGNVHYFPFLNLVYPAVIARKTNCPVLTIKSGSIGRKIKNIVLPVAGTVPKRKLEVAISITRKFKARVHLVTLPHNGLSDDNKKHAFFKAFYIIKENLPLLVRHAPLKGHNLAKATLSYAELIKADLILANPETESSFFSFGGKRHLSDMLLNNSPIQILDIESYSHAS